MPAHRVPLPRRFWPKVDKSGDCWLWIGARSGDGYGHIKVEGKMVKAHRVAYELSRGPIPEELDLDHLCRTPLCVNPAHLEPVTRRVNVLRGAGPTAVHASQAHCSRGHEFTPENTYARSDGGRTCRACNREDQQMIRERSRHEHRGL